MNRVVIIAPHADDEILGCGATIKKHIINNDEVFVIVATNAAKGAPELYNEALITTVRKEAQQSHDFLGIKETYYLDLPAPALNAFPEYKISIAIGEILGSIRPNIIYLPHPGDMHQDHKAIYRASLVAARPRDNNSISHIYCYETLSETDWSPFNESTFIPNHFVDVSDVFEEKLEAMKFFKSQLKEFPNSRSLENLEALAKFRGATVGVLRAEAFMVERQIIKTNFLDSITR